VLQREASQAFWPRATDTMARAPWATDLEGAFDLARAVTPGQPRLLAPPRGNVRKGRTSLQKNPYEGLLGPPVAEGFLEARRHRKSDVSKLIKTPDNVCEPKLLLRMLRASHL